MSEILSLPNFVSISIHQQGPNMLDIDLRPLALYVEREMEEERDRERERDYLAQVYHIYKDKSVLWFLMQMSWVYDYETMGAKYLVTNLYLSFITNLLFNILSVSCKYGV